MKGATMQAAVITQPSQVRIEEVRAPEPGPGQVRVRLEGCGVCASNIPPWEGRDWFEYPMPPGALGHEGWGVVDRIGAGVKTVNEGDRVAMMSNHAYAECDIADEANVVKLPEALADKPFPGEPLGCAMNIFSRSAVEPGHTVAVLGIGFLGSLLTQLCLSRGARVIAVTNRSCAQNVARRLGATHTLAWTDAQGVIQEVADITDGVGSYGEVTGWCDRVIECTGKQEAIDVAGEITAVRGTVVIAGFHQDGPRIVDMQLWNWRGLDIVNAHERDARAYVKGMRDAVAAVEEGRLTPGPLLTHSFALGELDQALEAVRTRPEGFVKGWVRMNHDHMEGQS